MRRDLSGADSGPQHPSGTGCGQQDCRNDPGSWKLHGDGNPEHKLGTASLRAGWVNCHTAYCRYAGPAKEKSAETAKSSGKTVAEDGIWGENLTRRLQELFGTPQDGKISNQLAVNRKFCDGITAAEWDSTPKGGSALVKEMQKWASAGMDGYIGPQTILAWQKKLGTPIDGTVSSPSAMVKKLQKWCNQK